MTNYQHYNKKDFDDLFSKGEIYNRLTKKYKQLFPEINDVENIQEFYPPQQSFRSNIEDQSVFFYSMFYYLEFLLEKHPERIADIGCGKNFIKEYIPNVVGFDKTKEADFNEQFDQSFIENNKETFDAAFAINSLHFRSLKDFESIIYEFGKIIKKGGRGFLAFNLDRFLINTQPHEYYQLFDLTNPVTMKHYRDYIINAIKNVEYKILVFDLVPGYQMKKSYDSVAGADWPTIENFINNNVNNVPQHILEEIASYQFLERFTTLGDTYNGNIQIVFEK